jgi:hypothetical protein
MILSPCICAMVQPKVPAQAGAHRAGAWATEKWVPACAGTYTWSDFGA